MDEDGWVYLKIVKGMYGLKQSGIIANIELTKHLDKLGYHPVQHTPEAWSVLHRVIAELVKVFGEGALATYFGMDKSTCPEV